MDPRPSSTILIAHPSLTNGAPATVMWPSFERTRRRLLGGPSIHADGEHDLPGADSPGVEADPSSADDVVLTIGRAELDRLGTALQALLGPQTARPDTPARLEAALATAVERLGGVGRPRVTRRPPGLYTPEAWQVRLSQIDPAIGEAIRGAARGMGFGT